MDRPTVSPRTTRPTVSAEPDRGRPLVAAVLLTRGDRPGELSAALASVRAQATVATEIIVVWNGAVVPAPAEPGVYHLSTDRNVGIPAGRNLGASHASARYVLFLDDDARLLGDELLASAVRRFDADPRVAVVCPRIVDPAGRTAQRHIPRPGRRGATRPGEVTSFLGGVAIIRREAFSDVGGYAAEFFYSMEETDLAWRLIDRGWKIWYAPELVVEHPPSDTSRHPDAAWRTARNRVWITHRSLPWPLGVMYLSSWLLIGVLRSPGETFRLLAGYQAGWRTRIGSRRPIRWRTVARLTRLGRPPIV